MKNPHPIACEREKNSKYLHYEQEQEKDINFFLSYEI